MEYESTESFFFLVPRKDGKRPARTAKVWKMYSFVGCIPRRVPRGQPWGRPRGRWLVLKRDCLPSDLWITATIFRHVPPGPRWTWFGHLKKSVSIWHSLEDTGKLQPSGCRSSGEVISSKPAASVFSPCRRRLTTQLHSWSSKISPQQQNAERDIFLARPPSSRAFKDSVASLEIRWLSDLLHKIIFENT